MITSFIYLIIELLILCFVYFVVQGTGVLSGKTDNIVKAVFVLIGLLCIVHAFGIY